MGVPRLVHAVAWPNVDAQFPDPVSARLVVSEMACRHSVDPPLNRHSGPKILQAVKPRLIGVPTGVRQVMANLHSP